MRQSTHFPKAIKNAQGLRTDMTNGEQRLWSELRTFRKICGLHVRKQVPIGPYIADFAFLTKKLVIELDGEFHFTAEGISKDKVREKWLAEKGFNVVRMTTAELNENLEGCINSILFELGLME